MGKPKMNRSAKGGIGRACTIEAKAFSFAHLHQGVCGRHGTEVQRVTSGELAKSPGGTGVSRPISESEVASEAWSVVGRLNTTYEAWRKSRDRATGDGIGSGKAAGEDGQEEKGNQMSKEERGRNSSLSEKPVRSRLRRLVDWINLTGAKKVHSLIDKMYKRKNLEMAWEKVKANRGSGGVDGQTLEAFEAQLEQQLDRLQRELKEDTYQPLPVRQHPIPKRDKPGEYRMLGIPAIYDRVCQQALLNRLEPIFEPIFDDASFGYRRGRSTKDALRKVWREIEGGSEWIVDADLRDFFGSVDHEKLLALVAQRVADGRVLRLIKAMLKAGSYGKGHLFPSERGTPQGGVVTPLTQKVTLAIWPTWRRTPVLWGARWNWDAVTNGDGVVPHQDIFDHEPYDSLALRDIKRLRRTAQAGEERCESLRQSQEGGPIVGLVSDRLELSTECLLALTQPRQALAWVLDRQEC